MTTPGQLALRKVPPRSVTFCAMVVCRRKTCAWSSVPYSCCRMHAIASAVAARRTRSFAPEEEEEEEAEDEAVRAGDEAEAEDGAAFSSPWWPLSPQTEPPAAAFADAIITAEGSERQRKTTTKATKRRAKGNCSSLKFGGNLLLS